MMKGRKNTPIELFCAREITTESIQADSMYVDVDEPGLLVSGNYLFEAPGAPITVLTSTEFERNYTVVITWTRPPAEAALSHFEEAHGFFRLASHEQALFCNRRERRIHTANGHVIYVGEKMLLRLGLMHWVEATLGYDEQAGCYFALDLTGCHLAFPTSTQEAALHPLGRTCWGIWG